MAVVVFQWNKKNLPCFTSDGSDDVNVALHLIGFFPCLSSDDTKSPKFLSLFTFLALLEKVLCGTFEQCMYCYKSTLSEQSTLATFKVVHMVDGRLFLRYVNVSMKNMLFIYLP